MFRNKRGQISIELLIILGILLLGAILVSVYYLQGVNKNNTQAAETESIIDDLYSGLGSETQIQPITECNNGPLHCCNNIHDATQGETGIDCGGACIVTCGQEIGFDIELHLKEPEHSPSNTNFEVFATAYGPIGNGSKLIKISITDESDFPSDNCSLVGSSPTASSYDVDIFFSQNMADFILTCDTPGTYTITADANLVSETGHITHVSASIQKFIYASTNYFFNDLYISTIESVSSVGNLFPIEVSADTDYDRINITQVEITREGAPTNNCSFFINNALKSCENGVCYNLGYLDQKETSSLFYNQFEFTCSESGVYGFKFRGLLDTETQEIEKETDINYISITESNYNLEPPIAQPDSGIYSAEQQIRLILPESAPTNAIIRYTTDGSEVTSRSYQYFYPIQISNDLLIRARVYYEQNKSFEAFFRYDILNNDIYFNNLSVFSYDSTYEKNQSFPLIVSADTNSPFVNLEKVEITKGGAPTNSCSFLRPDSRPVVCENGVCENLGFLSNFDYFSGYYESFLFTCDSAGSYDFNFTGTLDFGDGTSVSHSAQINIEVLESTYYLAPPIANPGSGIYPAGTKINLSLKDSLPGAYIRYTTNGSDVTLGSSRYSSPIVLNSDIVLKAKTFLDTQSSEQVEHNYYLPYEPYFEDLQITNMPLLSDRFIPFNIEVTAQTDMPIVYISEVEILDSSDQPTSACSYRGVSGDKFLNIPCENGSCQDLGFLSVVAENSYKNTFVFSCSDAGTYKFRFKGDLLDISHWSNQEQINIIADTYSCAVDDPIPGEIWCLEDLYNMYNTSIPGYSSTTIYSYPSITYILMRDLDFENDSHYREASNKTNWTTGEGWTPLNTIFGKTGKNSSAFFEGNDKNIINLYVNRPDSQNPNGSSKPVGFFKNVHNNVRNLNLIDVNIVGNSSVGALGGHAVFCRNVENINITGKITGENKVGGVFGEYFAPSFIMYQGPADINLFNWNSNIIVDGFDSVGGIIGKYSYYDSYHPPSTVGVPIFNNINSTGEIFSDYLNVGGVFGEVSGPSKTIFLKECSFDGNIYSEYTGDGARIGGLIGRLAAAAIIDSCEFNGSIFGNGEGGNGFSGTGGLIGIFYGGHIVNSKASGGVINNPLSDFVGGLVGNTGVTGHRGFIEKSYSDINLLGANYVGGIIAEAYAFDINECFSLGSVSGKDKVGGLIGELGYGEIFNSYSLGDVFRVVSGEGQHIAGFMGSRGSTYNVINSYSIGRVIYLDETSPTDKGFSGVVIHGYAWSEHPFSYGAGCYWDMDASQQTSTSVYPVPPNTPPVIGKSTVQMKDQSTFTTWDFTNIWNIDPSGIINNGYPYLRNNPPPEN